MVQPLPLDLVDPGELSFIPKAFGGGAQVVLNTTNTDDIFLQLNDATAALYVQRLGESNNNNSDGSLSPLTLMSTGCYVNSTVEAMGDYNGTGVPAGDGWRDCVQACAHPATMFNSSYTFWNCLTLGAASLYQENKGLVLGDLSAAGQGLGFASVDQFNGTQILGDTVQCIKSSCTDYSLGSCSHNITTLDISDAQDMVSALFDGVHEYCSGMDSVVNSDIAGPGVCTHLPSFFFFSPLHS